MIHTKSKLVQCISVALISLMLNSAFIANVQSQEEYFGLWACLNPEVPMGGYSGGGHPIMYAMDNILEELGIGLDIFIQGDPWANWELIWKPPLGGAAPGKPPYGWDLHLMDWWMHLTGFLWMDSVILSQCVPPIGYNAFPYLNQRNDELYWGMQTSVDPEARVAYAYAWQEEMMHNPPLVCMYYDYGYGMQSRYVQGWEDSCWWYDVSTLRINYTGTPWEPYLSSDLKSRLSQGTIIDGVNEPWLFYLALFPDSDMDEMLVDLTGGSLFRVSVDPWPAEEEIADPTDYYIKPWLASGHHVPLVEEVIEDPLDPTKDVYPVKIPLREGVVWSDDVPFNATDVKYTYDLVVNPDVLSSAFGDFEPIVKRAEYMYDNNTIAWGKDWTEMGAEWDPYSVALICHDKDYADLELILANMWGAGIVPYHVIKPIVDAVGPRKLRNHAIATDADYARENLPAIGPFKYGYCTPPWGYADMEFLRNEKFFGYNASLLTEDELINGQVWGPYGINKLIIRYISDPATLFTTVQTHEVDIAEYVSGTIEDFEALMDDPTILVKETISQTGNFIWFNFNNPHLSNRYVRLAIAHAVPYGRIIKEILPAWGVTKTIPGISWVTPWQVYAHPENGGVTGYSLFNKDLEPYEYDPVKASAYLDMYLKSRRDLYPDQAVGPVGDANFDGKVNLDDLFLLIDKWSETPPYKIDWWPPEKWKGTTEYLWPVAEGASVAPGNDIDIDFNNDGSVSSADFALWLQNWGKEYPFPGAR